MERSPGEKERVDAQAIRKVLDRSLSKMIRRSEVRIKRFYKAVAPASTGHGEFLTTLKEALPEGEYDDWYRTWTAADAKQES
jgi:hypothetical protein